MGIIGSNPNYSEVYIGVDVGQAQDPTAIVIADPELRDGLMHFPIRFLKRLPLGLPYPGIIAEIQRIYSSIPKREDVTLNKHLWIDATGVGKPIVDLLRGEIPNLYSALHAVFLTGGEAKAEINPLDREISLPKAYLVSRLQVLIGCSRVHLPNTAEAYVMREELMNYQIKVNESSNAQFGAFRVGTHDDLVTALGLACLCERSAVIPRVVSANRRGHASQILRGYW